MTQSLSYSFSSHFCACHRKTLHVFVYFTIQTFRIFVYRLLYLCVYVYIFYIFMNAQSIRIWPLLLRFGLGVCNFVCFIFIQSNTHFTDSGVRRSSFVLFLMGSLSSGWACKCKRYVIQTHIFFLLSNKNWG